MPRRRSATPTEGELEILNVLWTQGPATVRQIYNTLKDRRGTGYSTTLRMVQVMTEKGLILKDDSVRPQVYAAAAPQEQTQLALVDHLIQSGFGGSAMSLVLRAAAARRITPELTSPRSNAWSRRRKGAAHESHGTPILAGGVPPGMDARPFVVGGGGSRRPGVGRAGDAPPPLTAGSLRDGQRRHGDDPCADRRDVPRGPGAGGECHGVRSCAAGRSPSPCAAAPPVEFTPPKIGPRAAAPIEPPAPPAAVIAAPAAARRGWTVRWQRAVEPYLPWLVAAWLAGVLALSLWRGRLGGRIPPAGCGHATGDPGHPVDGPAPDDGCSLSRPVRIVQSLVVQTPMVIGWLRPVILLPVAAVTGLAPDQLEAILAHELAHIRRLDYLVNLLQAAVEVILFYHPAVWWVGRRMRAERERCCDDVAVRLVGNPIRYVEALAAVEGVRQPAATRRGGGLGLGRKRPGGPRAPAAGPARSVAGIGGRLGRGHPAGPRPVGRFYRGGHLGPRKRRKADQRGGRRAADEHAGHVANEG